MGKLKQYRIRLAKFIMGNMPDPCHHKYELLKKHEREVDYGNGLMDSITIEDIYIYCPKCRTRRKVTPLEWELLQKEQSIDEKFMKKHGVENV